MATAIGTLLLAAATFLTVKAVYTQMKLDRLVKEMEYLVAPLHSKIIYDPGKEPWGNRRFFKKGTARETYLEYIGFWDPILLNKHLGVSFLRKAINNYFDNKSSIAGDDNRDEMYEAAEKILISAVTKRYSEIEKEIDRIETKHWWQIWK